MTETTEDQKGDSLSVKAPSKQKPHLRVIKPKTINQHKIFNEFYRDQNLFIHGTAGTGKTFLALYLALDAVNSRDFSEVIVVRSAVPARRQGFLPGNEEEKNEIFEIPYESIVNELHGAGGVYKALKNEKKVRFLSTSYLRGITLENAIVIVDEVQNFNGGEIDTVMTRLGEGCQVIICGDTAQNDLIYLHEDSCIENLKKIVNRMDSFSLIEMTPEDIQRDDVVREWIEARDHTSNTHPRFA